MKKRTIELVTGLCILAIVFVFIIYIINAISGSVFSRGYRLYGYFDQVGGLERGTSVLLKGVKIGNVSSVVFDSNQKKIKVSVNIDSNIKIPKDSRLVIIDAGLFSGRIVRVVLGDSSELMTNGDLFSKTYDYNSLEDKISKLFFSSQ